jgi:adenylate cyclase
MATEVERKFLVDTARLGPLQEGMAIRQGFISTRDHTVVRVRLAGDSAWLTLKGESKGAARSEFEYAIPPREARQIIAELCHGRVIAKTRYSREYAGHRWDIDVFEGENAGLVIAEVELASESEPVPLPDWVAEEVTGDARYYNVNLVSHPFSHWTGR